MIKLSPSSITTLKMCPMKYYYSYVLGLRPTEDTESQRMGTIWHEGLHILSMKEGDKCYGHGHNTESRDSCIICNNTGIFSDPLTMVTQYLNNIYDNKYKGLDKIKAATERTVLLYSLIAYKWYYDRQESIIEVIKGEQKFAIPLINTDTNEAVDDCMLNGVIDKMILDPKNMFMGLMEHKSTSNSIDEQSNYWSHLKLDTQTFFYIYVLQRLKYANILTIKDIEKLTMSLIFYDVWHKPMFRPKKITLIDTNTLLSTGKYFDRDFEVKADINEQIVLVNGEQAEINPAKKGFYITETIDMFGVRLLQEICQEPDKYFKRKQIFRSSEDIEEFEKELFKIYTIIKIMTGNNTWYHNEWQCEAMGYCQYCNLCYNRITPDPNNPPIGFRFMNMEKYNA